LTYSDGLRVDLKTYSDLFSRTCQQLPDLFSPEAKLIIPCPCCILRHGKTVWGRQFGDNHGTTVWGQPQS